MYLWHSSTAQALLRSTQRLQPALPAARAVVRVAEVPPAAVAVAAAVAAFSLQRRSLVPNSGKLLVVEGLFRVSFGL
jgi:hypothetical protein